MKFKTNLLKLVSLILLSCSSSNKDILILKQGNLIDVNTGNITTTSIYIQNGEIKEIGNFDELRIRHIGRDNIIDCTSKYILPGLFDMHTHIYEEQNSYQYLNKLLKKGITSIRDMGGVADSIANWKYSDVNKRFNIPNICFVGYTLDGEGSTDSHHILIRNRNDIDSLMIKFDSLQVDALKVHNFFPDSLINTLVEKGKQFELKVVGHIPLGVSLEYAVNNFATIEHASSLISALVYQKDNGIENITQAFIKLDSEYLTKLSKLFNESGTAFTPTLYTHYLGYEQVSNTFQKELGMKMYKRFEMIVKHLAENDVIILAGSDVVPISSSNLNSLHMELEALSKAGLDNLKVIQSATINPAKVLKINDRYGTISKGKIADLVLLKDNPLNDVTNINKVQLVIKNGKIID